MGINNFDIAGSCLQAIGTPASLTGTPLTPAVLTLVNLVPRFGVTN